MGERIPVKTPVNVGKSYEIVIKGGLLADIEQYLSEYALDGHVVIATNPTVRALYGDMLTHKLPNAHIITMEDGEQYKNLQSVHSFYNQMIACGADRHTTLLALGGGVVGDTAGFVAATFMRGIRLIQIPTTLLAMVDSSVGGKVGVDLPQGKNLVGAFKNPVAVLVDPQVLASLSAEQWRCGMAEVIKHGFIADEALLDPSLHRPESASELVRRAVQVKVDIVEQDPYEAGIRAYLNLGHTFAHAIEQVTNYAWLHGEAVGFGLLAAVKLSHKLALCDAELVERVDTILAEIGLPRSIGNLSAELMWEAMLTDKKWKDGISRFVLLEAAGKPTIVQGISRDVVIGLLRDENMN